MAEPLDVDELEKRIGKAVVIGSVIAHELIAEVRRLRREVNQIREVHADDCDMDFDCSCGVGMP